jgi:hypothetical protein
MVLVAQLAELAGAVATLRDSQRHAAQVSAARAAGHVRRRGGRTGSPSRRPGRGRRIRLRRCGARIHFGCLGKSYPRIRTGKLVPRRPAWLILIRAGSRAASRP